MTIAISVIIPAYNEAARLPGYLAEVRTFLETHYPDAHELIVVDDGSRDGTAPMLVDVARRWPALRVITQPANQGKGAAVRTGMLAANGGLMLFTDADGATPIAETAKLSAAIDHGADVAIGSRLVQVAGLTRHRTWLRRLAGRGFASLARWWLDIPEQDTQCGFKMFRREVGRQLFLLSGEDRYLFDLELLALAHRMSYRVAEVPVNWHEVPGSHLSLTRESLRILYGLTRIRRRVQELTAAGRA